MPTGTAVVVIYYFEITFSCIFVCITAKMHPSFSFIRISFELKSKDELFHDFALIAKVVMS